MPYKKHHIKNGKFLDVHSRNLFMEDIVISFKSSDIKVNLDNIVIVSELMPTILSEEKAVFILYIKYDS